MSGSKPQTSSPAASTPWQTGCRRFTSVPFVVASNFKMADQRVKTNPA
jgi:hypothetical protein